MTEARKRKKDGDFEVLDAVAAEQVSEAVKRKQELIRAGVCR